MRKASVSPFKNTDEKKKDKKSNDKWKVFCVTHNCRKKEKRKTGHCKAFCVTRTRKKKAIKAIAKLSVLRANVQTRKAIVKLFALHAVTIMLMCSACQMLCQMSIFKYFQSVFRIRNYLRKTFKTEKFKNITSF